MPRIVIWLARHGRIPQVSPRRFVGQRDLPLDDIGRRQAEWIRTALSGEPLERVVSSDLSRAMDTARIATWGRTTPIEPEPRLREISLGQWEGLTKAEVQARFPGQHERRGREMDTFRPPGGESFEDLRNRAWPAFEAICMQAAGPTLVTAHAGVNRVILVSLLGMDLANLFSLEQDYGCLNAVLRVNGRLRLGGHNLCSAQFSRASLIPG